MAGPISPSEFGAGPRDDTALEAKDCAVRARKQQLDQQRAGVG